MLLQNNSSPVQNRVTVSPPKEQPWQHRSQSNENLEKYDKNGSKNIPTWLQTLTRTYGQVGISTTMAAILMMIMMLCFSVGDFRAEPSVTIGEEDDRIASSLNLLGTSVTKNQLRQASLRNGPLPPSSSMMTTEGQGPAWFAIVIGAGAAGLSAAYELYQQGIPNIVVVEASHRIGGRMWKDTSFVHYPIELGATVVHEPDTLNKIAGHKLNYDETPNGELFLSNYTYTDFFSEHVASVLEKDPNSDIVLGCQVTRVTYEADHPVNVVCANGQSFSAHYAVVTVSLSILQEGDISFQPRLPKNLVEDHPGKMWSGFKIFLQFSKPWFRDETFCLLECPGETPIGESYFWDYGVPDQHVLAGLVMGHPMERFRNMSEQEIVSYLLRKLEKKFHGKPISKWYHRHLFVNWTAQPFVRGTYASLGLEGPHNVQDQLFMAGEAYPLTQEQNGWVHGAFNSGRAAARMILSLERRKRGRRQHHHHHAAGRISH